MKCIFVVHYTVVTLW